MTGRWGGDVNGRLGRREKSRSMAGPARRDEADKEGRGGRRYDTGVSQP